MITDPQPQVTPRNRDRRVVVGYLAFLSMLLAFGVDIALPAFDDMRASFGMTPDDTKITLVITVYFVGLAFGQLIFGIFSDSVGRQRALMMGLSLYMIGAILASLAPSFGFLLAARFIWGLGAAGPGVIRMAIARDLYNGDEMAKLVTIVMAVFLIGPIFVPFIGEAILSFASWPFVFVAALTVAAIAFLMSLKFGETLPPERRQPFSLQPLGVATKRVLTTPATVGRIIAQTFFSGAFFVFLGSSQPIISQIYDRKDQFAAWFAVIGVFTILFLLVNNRLITRYGARRLLLTFATIEIGLSAVGLAYFMSQDGVPPFGVWFVWVTLASSMLTIVAPMCNGLALEPMGEIAGTASAVLGFATMAGGALLASFVDARIEGSITPMAAAYLGYSLVALVALWWANNSQRGDAAA